MLVLTRKVGEAVILDHEHRIVVVEIDGGHVRLGFDVAPNVAVNREEVEDRMDADALHLALEKCGGSCEETAGPALPDPVGQAASPPTK